MSVQFSLIKISKFRRFFRAVGDIQFPELLKRSGGHLVMLRHRHVRFSRCIFLLGHMRAGTTALSNILCSRDDVSGFGEAHVRYASRSAPGMLALSQIRQRVFEPSAYYLFDKVLHSHLDENANEAFFQAKAIFLTRKPEATIPSILNLFAQVDSPQYQTYQEAADYYTARIARLGELWSRFSPSHRVSMTYSDITGTPGAHLSALTDLLALNPPLANRYDPSDSPVRNGAGDPLVAGSLNKIVRRATSASSPDVLSVSEADALSRAQAAHAAFLAKVAG